MDFSDIFRLVNLAVGVVMILGGIGSMFDKFQVQNIIVGVYVIIFGLVVGFLEFQIPPQISRYASFLFSFLGRGIFYIFTGCIIIDKPVLKIIAGGLIVLVGIAYAALEFVPSVEPPANMRDADAGWGAEQV